MAEIKYNPETGVFTRKGSVWGTLDERGYLIGTLSNKRVYLHRLAFKHMGEPVPDIVDHINGNRKDNRWCNLRPADNTTSMQNRSKPSHNTSGYKGVSYHRGKQKYHTRITVNKKVLHLGYFDCPVEAYKAYCGAADKHFKEFARYE